MNEFIAGRVEDIWSRRLHFILSFQKCGIQLLWVLLSSLRWTSHEKDIIVGFFPQRNCVWDYEYGWYVTWLLLPRVSLEFTVYVSIV